jgi:biopolymer transport protein TolR
MAIKADAGGESAGRTRSALAEINVIPLVDVVLVLLLIFMLTAPMMYRGIDVNLPKTSSKPTAIEERLVLTITKDRLLYLNERPLPLATLEARLRDLIRDRTDKTIFVKADKDLAYGYVVETMDRIRRAGVERVGMVTEPLPVGVKGS